MPLVANTSFERYCQGDVIRPAQEERFRGTYPYAVVEASEEDMDALRAARENGSVGAWIEAMCARPTVQADQEAELAASAEADGGEAPEPRVSHRGGKRAEPKPATKPEPEPATNDEDGDN